MNQVFEGDCQTHMRRWPDGQVDLAFADPPYNIGEDYDIYEDRRPVDEYLGWCRSWISEIHRLLKPDGTFWLVIGDEMVAELKLICQQLGFRPRSWVVWYYTFGVNCTHKFSRSHAHLLHFVKNTRKFTFRPDQIRIPSARSLVYNDKRAHGDGRLPDDTWIIRPQQIPEAFQPDEDVWYIPRVAGTFKQRRPDASNQLPEAILSRIIRPCSHDGELVFDPFLGTGTTAAVAKKLGRRYLGCELSPLYYKNCCERIAEVKEGDPLDGFTE